jgi:hydroxymethylglutaryl-CoA lyase
MRAHLPSHVTVVEVGPRDGLQNEPERVSTEDKIAFVDALSAAGLPVIEASAFVSPKRVPQMGDAPEVLAGIHRHPGIRYSALVPNLAGLERAHAAGVSDVAIFAAASETFSRTNINQTIDASLSNYR